jgi:hypothetical protein
MAEDDGLLIRVLLPWLEEVADGGPWYSNSRCKLPDAAALLKRHLL